MERLSSFLISSSSQTQTVVCCLIGWLTFSSPLLLPQLNSYSWLSNMQTICRSPASTGRASAIRIRDREGIGWLSNSVKRCSMFREGNYISNQNSKSLERINAKCMLSVSNFQLLTPYTLRFQLNLISHKLFSQLLLLHFKLWELWNYVLL